MTYLVLSDIHANLEALTAVLADADGQYDAVIQLGDLVDYGPNPNEVVEQVLELPLERSLLGNHDLAVLQPDTLGMFNPLARASAGWTARILGGEVRSYLEALEPAGSVKGLTLVHASPRDPVWEYLDDPYVAAENFPLFTTATCLNGHTHVPRVFAQSATQTGPSKVAEARSGTRINLGDGQRRIVNPGSVGQPRDGNPEAAYALYDTDTGVLQLRRVPYEIAKTQQKIISAGLPHQLADRLSYGL